MADTTKHVQHNDNIIKRQHHKHVANVSKLKQKQNMEQRSEREQTSFGSNVELGGGAPSVCELLRMSVNFNRRYY
eukprot:11157305-Lingulodinium_polyedra.AAC.1